MKILVYDIICNSIIYNEEMEITESVPTITSVIVENPTDKDIENAERASYNGQYKIEETEEETPVTTEQRITELETALTLLLEGVTE